jgi:autotransporter-associated beta strand protein
LSGVGVTNNSGIVQQFIAPADNAGGAGAITFTNAAIAGELTTYTNPGGTDGGAGGAVTFMDNASAASGTFINHGSLSGNALGGITGFFGNSSAGNGTFIQNGSAVLLGSGGETDFHNASTAASGTFTLNGGTGSSGFGGLVQFFDTATAANAMFTVNGGETAGGFGGELAFLGTSTADNCTILANGTDVPGAAGAFILFAAGAAANGGNATVIINGGATAGALLTLAEDTDGRTARIEVFDNGTVDVSFHDPPGVTIGSVEGTGILRLGERNLTVGSNNLSTTFSGTVRGTATNHVSLTKVGTGTLILTNANTYKGGTAISAGQLVVNNMDGSGTGSGAVRVRAGILAGRGTIAGDVIVGTGSGNGAALAPGRRGSKTDTLTILSALTFQFDSTYKFELKSSTATADKVVANGVTINGGALFSFTDLDSAVLPIGTVFTAVDNTAATPIVGTFANLPDDSTFTIGNNTYQVDYQGGDGNDLTLTVIR